MKSFEGLEYLEKTYYGKIPAYDKAENYTAMTSSIAIGFWLRRKIDGTNNYIWNALTELMTTYDNRWFKVNIKNIN